MKLSRIRLTAEALEDFPADERAYFFLAGHIRNECSMLADLLSWCTQTPDTECPEPDVQRMVRGYRALMLGKQFLAKLHEAKVAINTPIDKESIGQIGSKRLGDGWRERLREFNRYFSRAGDYATHVRNSFAFHYLYVSDIEDHWREAAKDVNFDILVDNESGRSFHAASEAVSAVTLLKTLSAGDLEETLNTFLEDLVSLDGLLSGILNEFMIASLDQWCPDWRDQIDEIEIDESLPDTKWSIPIFYKP